MDSLVLVIFAALSLWTAYRVYVFVGAYYRVNARGTKVAANGESQASRSIKPYGISIFEFVMWYFTQDTNFVTHYIYNAICIFCLRYITP